MYARLVDGGTMADFRRSNNDFYLAATGRRSDLASLLRASPGDTRQANGIDVSIMRERMVQIRPYRHEDWAAVWPIVCEVIAAGETYAWDPACMDDCAREQWVPQPPWRVVVAVDGDTMLGTAKIGPNRPGAGAHVATASFMVGSAARGRGVGRALGEHILDLARQDGYAAMQFNAVVETNEGAVRLWRSLGFAIIGTVPEAFEHPTEGRVGLHTMHRLL